MANLGVLLKKTLSHHHTPVSERPRC